MHYELNKSDIFNSYSEYIIFISDVATIEALRHVPPLGLVLLHV